jgi:hypothetical protein
VLGAIAAFGLTALVAFVFCALVGRRWAVLPPLLIWPIFVLGLTQGWWGDDPGPEAQVGLTIAVGVVAAAVGGTLGVLGRSAMTRSHGERLT